MGLILILLRLRGIASLLRDVAAALAPVAPRTAKLGPVIEGLHDRFEPRDPVESDRLPPSARTEQVGPVTVIR